MPIASLPQASGIHPIDGFVDLVVVRNTREFPVVPQRRRPRNPPTIPRRLPTAPPLRSTRSRATAVAPSHSSAPSPPHHAIIPPSRRREVPHLPPQGVPVGPRWRLATTSSKRTGTPPT
ncbi:hypothetical protein PVAP13_9KG210885 [Panicum virgatum]|uniref:Uncharacterized protein n=1 Tax=Panicum virgatum TaxID=38727 RepID=A0A8T0NHA7_PANVG|nr:hypothetical protein PVAP13_9KG210885 [Panicum virgatum]